jgi:lactate permease
MVILLRAIKSNGRYNFFGIGKPITQKVVCFFEILIGKSLMAWTQEVNPFHNIALSAFAAVIPVIFIFWALVIKKMKGYMASLLTMIICILIAVLIYHMPVGLSLLSGLHGALYGFFPICWIIISAVFLYNITVVSGQFVIIKSFMSSITNDRRLQALLIAFSFGSFLEGASGPRHPYSHYIGNACRNGV